MQKIIASIKYRPLNLVLILSVISLYLINNNLIKPNTTRIVHIFCVSFFNDLLCPYFFLAYANLLLITCGREMTKLKILMLVCLAAGCVWEFVAPYLKHGSVTDPIDLICYVISTVGYWKLLNTIIKRDGEKNDRN